MRATKIKLFVEIKMNFNVVAKQKKKKQKSSSYQSSDLMLSLVVGAIFKMFSPLPGSLDDVKVRLASSENLKEKYN